MIREVDKDRLSLFNLNESDSPYRRYLAYILDENIVGYLTFDLIYDRIEIVNLYVKEEFRDQGIGFSLLSSLINFSKTKNIINITLEVSSLNDAALHLYRKLGFKDVALRKGYYNGVDGILMELIL